MLRCYRHQIPAQCTHLPVAVSQVEPAGQQVRQVGPMHGVVSRRQVGPDAQSLGSMNTVVLHPRHPPPAPPQQTSLVANPQKSGWQWHMPAKQAPLS